MKRILVTSTNREKSTETGTDEKFEVVYCPTIEISRIELEENNLHKIKNYFEYDYLIFTSKNAVRFFFEYLGTNKINTSKVKVAVTGESTAEEIKRISGTVPEILPEKFNAETLLDSFPENLKGRKVLIPGSKISRGVLREGLAKKGAKVDFIPIYNTRVRQFTENNDELEVLKSNFDAYIFTSPSSFVAFLEILKIENLNKYFENKAIIPIGNITEKEIVEAGIVPHKPPENFLIPNAVELAKRILSRKSKL